MIVSGYESFVQGRIDDIGTLYKDIINTIKPKADRIREL